MKAKKEGATVVSYAEQTVNNKVEELDFEALLIEFNEIVNNLIENVPEEIFSKQWSPVITQITEKYLGKGKKVNQCSKEQVEALMLIVEELKDTVKNK